MIFKQETIQSWFSGVESSINSEVIQPFQNAEQVIWKYNQAIQHNSLTQQGWERLLAQSDDSLKAYLTSIKGTTATITGYNVSLQGNITGFKKVSSAITQYNALSASGTKEQNTFANAVSVTNGKLGTYLTGLNGAKASLGGYVISLVGATIKTVTLKVATIALNSAITMGASLIISGIVSAISEWIHKTENMISASEDAIEKIKSINDELKNNQKTISDTAKRYAELAQGVDQLTGKNISLSNEDYEEFLTLSNQLAEIFPTLTRNYNDNGDAIVQLSGDVDTIVGSLRNLIEAQRDLANRQIVDELPTVFDGIAAKSDKYEQQLSDLESRRDTLVKSLGDVQSEEFSSNFMNGFSNKWIEISGDNLEVISQMRDDYMKILKEANIDFEELTPTYEIKDGVEIPVGFTIKINSSDEDVEKAKNTIDGQIQELASQYETDIKKLNEEINTTNEKNKANWTSLSSSIFAWLSTEDSFKVMDDTTQATVQNIVNSLDWGSLDFSSWEEAKQYIQDNILLLFSTPNGKSILNKWAEIFSNADLSLFDKANYIKQIQDYFGKDNPITISLQPQLEDIESLQKQYQETMRKAYAKFGGDQYDDRGFVTGDTVLDNFAKENSINTEEERAFWDKCIEESETREEAMQKYLNYGISSGNFSDIFALKNSDDSLTELGKINEEIEKFQSAYKGLKSAMDSYNETGYFTLDQVQEIISHGDEYLKYLVDENGQLQLNEEALNNVAIARINEMRAKVLSDLMNNLEGITNEESALKYLSTQLYETADSYDDFTASRIQAWSIKALDEYGMDQTVIDGIVKNFTNQAAAINEMFDNLNIDSFGKSLDKAGSKAETDWKKLLDAELNLLDKQLEAGLISFNDYINKRKGLIEDYYNDGKIAADEYYTYLEEHYKKELSYMDKVINAVTRKIDKEIKGLKEQQDAIKERYQLEIDKLNEQKKLIEEANAERQRQIDLQKALYELERAQNQRTTLMYSEEKGMHYVANSGAIRDAQNNLEDKEYEIKISEIEKSIEKLEEARDRELEAIDEMIERLEEYKEYWNEISSEYENQQEELLAAQILGQDWEKQILDQRLDTLKKFKDRYIEIQQAIVDAAYEAAKARGEEAERTIIGDSSARKPGDDPKIKGWEVVNEDGGESEGVYNTEEEAKAESQLLNKRKAKSYGMSLEEFLDSNIPKYYVLKKYHTGLKQGLVDSHTFDDDFKLVQKVGLGQDEVPAILQKNEAVITPDQISNLANGLRNYTLPEYITPLSLDDSFLNTLIFDNNIAKKMNESMSKLANSISNKTTGINEIKQEFYITLPNVTDNTAAITLMRDLESLATKKLHEF